MWARPVLAAANKTGRIRSQFHFQREPLQRVMNWGALPPPVGRLAVGFRFIPFNGRFCACFRSPFNERGGFPTLAGRATPKRLARRWAAAKSRRPRTLGLKNLFDFPRTRKSGISRVGEGFALRRLLNCGWAGDGKRKGCAGLQGAYFYRSTDARRGKKCFRIFLRQNFLANYAKAWSRACGLFSGTDSCRGDGVRVVRESLKKKLEEDCRERERCIWH